MKFKLDINLDDEAECTAFINTHSTTKGRTLANRLNLRGKGAVKLANGLSGYAWNKYVAIGLRKRGIIQEAQRYEAVCDSIYSEDIQPVCECW